MSHIHIDKIMSSAQKRGLMSAKYFREGYSSGSQNGKSPKFHLYLKAHSFAGCYKGKETFPGCNLNEIHEIVPDIVIDEQNAVKEDQGWFTKQTIETPAEITLRVKDVIRELKDMHRSNPLQTIFISSHGCFLRYLICLLTDQKSMLPNCNLQCANNSLTILDMETKENIPAKTEYVDVRLVAYNL